MYSLLATVYLSLFSLYWLWTVAHFCADLRPLAEVRGLFRDLLGVSEAALSGMKWSEVVHR